ncbi:hypothetical protein [Porphyromonas levii]|uniref:hypothetical protein n=1 Tax=Porphyromonas levii TaxID=28114 RepID=UPI00036EEF5C|nr:hypothetical protein [Porphyromonas levii]
MKRWLFLLCLILSAPMVEGQEAVELLLQELEDEAEAEWLGSFLAERLAHPLDINSASEAELLELPYFDTFFVRNLLLERSRRGGRFRSIYELKEVQGAPLQQLPLLEPFIVAGEREERPQLAQELFAGFEGQLPLRRDQYRGIGWGTRYAGSFGARHTWSVLAGKDRGEPRRVDYLSASYRYEAAHWSVIAGDYRVSAGLGIHLGQSLSYFSRAEIVGQAPMLSRRVLRQHSSFREYGFLRGVGASIDLGALNVVLFGGTEPIDARVEGSKVVTLYPGGMHRTTDEVARRHAAQRATVGAVISYRVKAMEVGGTAMVQRYLSPKFEPMQAPDRHQQMQNGSLFFQYQNRRWRIAGESLLAKREGLSSLATVSYYTDRLGRVSLMGHYSGDQSFTPYGFRQGKRGVQATWVGELARWWRGMLYLSYSDKGWGTTARAEYNYDKHVFRARLRYARERATARLTHQYQFNEQLVWRSGLNLSRTAWGAFVRGQWSFAQGLRIEGGLQYFNTNGGVIRADQPYMPWRYYVPMLRGKGLRATAQVRYKVQAAQVYLRTAHVFYSEAPHSPLPSLLELSTTIRF